MVDFIADTIRGLLANWVGQKEKPHQGCIVMNGGSNMITLARLLGQEHISCVANLLHLMVKNALVLSHLEETMVYAGAHEFQLLFQTCWHIMSHFSCRIKDPFLLLEKQTLISVPEHLLIGDISTHLHHD